MPFQRNLRASGGEFDRQEMALGLKDENIFTVNLHQLGRRVRANSVALPLVVL